MAKEGRRLTVRFSGDSLKTLDSIWDWNAQAYGPDHADAYISFLRQTVERLAISYAAGRPVPHRRDLRYIIIRRKPKGHGHLVVYRVAQNGIDVLDFFHTAQDWPKNLPPTDRP